MGEVIGQLLLDVSTCLGDITLYFKVANTHTQIEYKIQHPLLFDLITIWLIFLQSISSKP